MTQLRLKLHQPMAHGYLEAGAMATVRQLADATGKRPIKGWWTRELPVSVSGADGGLGEPAVFDLPQGGRYAVTITRPRGADIEREVVVDEGEVRSETIELQVSPHEYLGWQQYAGIVRSDPYRREADARSPAPPKSGNLRIDSMMTRGRNRIEELYKKAGAQAGAGGVPTLHAAEVPSSAQAWTLVEEAARGGQRDWTRSGGALDWQAQWDDELAAWLRPMPDAGEGAALVERLGRAPDAAAPAAPVEARFPRWISVAAADGGVDLASVPWAWWGARRSDDEEIRFLFDRIRPSPVDRDSPGYLTLSVQDRRWFGLLEFLASDRLHRAGPIAAKLLPDAEQALYGKARAPLVAVAGGILLIAQAKSSERQDWDAWLENLTEWFPGVPDGPILLGCRRVEQARKLEDLTAAYGHLRAAIERGIPFFSASLRMLGTTLAQIGDDVPEADRERRRIATVAARVDPAQPFTVVRI